MGLLVVVCYFVGRLFCWFYMYVFTFWLGGWVLGVCCGFGVCCGWISLGVFVLGWVLLFLGFGVVYLMVVSEFWFCCLGWVLRWT